MPYSFIDYTDMIRVLIQCDDNASLAARTYAELYPNRRHPAPNTFRQVFQRLRDRGRFDVPRESGAPRLNANIEDRIVNYVERHPDASSRLVGKRFNVSHSVVWSILKRDHQHPHHLQPKQGKTAGAASLPKTPHRSRSRRLQVSKPCQSNSNAEEAGSPGSGGDESPAGGGEGGRGRGGEGACAACGGDVGTHGRRARGSPAERLIEAAIFPRELNEKTLLCNDCYNSYRDKDKQKGQKNPRKSSQSKEASKRVALSEKSANANVSTPPTIRLPNYKRASYRSEGCLFPNCQIERTCIIPQYAKQRLLRDYKLYTTERSRVCKEHLSSKKWGPLLNIAKSDFTAQQIEDLISILATNVAAFNFDNIEDISPNLLLYCTGVNHKQLQKILDQLPSLTKRTKTPVRALTAYLAKLRTIDISDRLSTLFQTEKRILEKLTTVAKDCMLKELVPGHSSDPSSSDGTNNVSGDIDDDRVLRFLQEHYYVDVARTEDRTAVLTRLETVASSKPSRKRKNGSDSDSDDESLAKKAAAKKRKAETNESIENDSEQQCVATWLDVKFESPDRAEAGFESESSEAEGESEQPRFKKEAEDEGVTEDEGEMEDPQEKQLVYAPNPTEDLQADPLDTGIDTVAVPTPLLEQVKSEDLVTVKAEPGDEESQGQPIVGTTQATGDSPFTVYYTKGITNFVQRTH